MLLWGLFSLQNVRLKGLDRRTYLTCFWPSLFDRKSYKNTKQIQNRLQVQYKISARIRTKRIKTHWTALSCSTHSKLIQIRHVQTENQPYSEYIHSRWHFALGAYVAIAAKPMHSLQIRPIVHNSAAPSTKDVKRSSDHRLPIIKKVIGCKNKHPVIRNCPC